MIGLTRATFGLAWHTVAFSLPTGEREPPPVFDMENSNGVLRKKRVTTEGRMVRYDRGDPTGCHAPHVSLRSIPQPDISTKKKIKCHSLDHPMASCRDI